MPRPGPTGEHGAVGDSERVVAHDAVSELPEASADILAKEAVVPQTRERGSEDPTAKVNQAIDSWAKQAAKKKRKRDDSRPDRTGQWFAEGLAAERQLASSEDGEPLPSMYDGVDEERRVGEPMHEQRRTLGVRAERGVVVITGDVGREVQDDVERRRQRVPVRIGDVEPSGRDPDVVQSSPACRRSASRCRRRRSSTGRP